jgi:putative transposase
MYRVLGEAKELKERRDQRRHPKYHKPVLSATGPNQLWSWDITRLPGEIKGKYYFLYVMMDVFSRYVVG